MAACKNCESDIIDGQIDGPFSDATQLAHNSSGGTLGLGPLVLKRKFNHTYPQSFTLPREITTEIFIARPLLLGLHRLLRQMQTYLSFL